MRRGAVIMADAALVARFHALWSAPPDQAVMQNIIFMENVSILGGMMLLYTCGPGRFSVDKG